MGLRQRLIGGGIFLAEEEVVFFFEGEQADELVRSILNDPVRSSAIGPWLPLFDGPLHTAYEAYFWEEGRKTNRCELDLRSFIP